MMRYTYNCVTTLPAMGPLMTAAPPLGPLPGTPLYENDVRKSTIQIFTFVTAKFSRIY